MSVLKKYKSGFAQIPNKLLNDDRLRLKAKGLFCFMASKPDGWNFTLKSIASQTKDGLNSVFTAMSELKKHGYVEYIKHSDGTGEYILNADPKLHKPKLRKSKIGKPQCISNKDCSNKDCSNKDCSNTPYNPPNEKKFELPSAINRELWDEFEEHRKEIKKPLTDLARKKNIQVLMDNLQHQEQIINTTIANGWVGLFPPKKIVVEKSKPQVGSYAWMMEKEYEEQMKKANTIETEVVE